MKTKLRSKVAFTTVILFISLLQAGCSTFSKPSSKAAVATAHPLATQAAFRVLDQGGNAFDAAVAAAAMLAVVEPYGSGLGGGGFWLLQKKNGESVFIDAREKAPLAASRNMYLDEYGEPLADRPSINGALAAGIPGQVAAFGHIARNYGIMPLSRTIKDAIQISENGFRVTNKYLKMATFRKNELAKHSTSSITFLENSQLPEHQSYLKQPLLAETLKRIARYGTSDFYRGEVAKKLVQDVQKAGGIWTTEDLARYRVIERQPIVFNFENYQITTAPPPSSGGIALAQMFGALERLPRQKTPYSPLQEIALNTEIMRFAYRDRALHLGDPDFVDIPVADLLDKHYLKYMAATIDKTVTGLTPGAQLPVTEPTPDDKRHTTHFSIIDGYGNKASVTLSINLPFGSGFTSPQTGVLLNNEMDDFSIKPGHPNAYGLVGNEANAIEPGKRPLSSMTPTIVENGDNYLITGTPGGSRIISMVYHSIRAYIQGEKATSIVAKKRYHHQYKPDVIQHEPDTFSETERQQLQSFGYQLKNVGRDYGNMQVILRRDNMLESASDPRGIGQAITRQ